MELLQPMGLTALVGLPVVVALYFLRRRWPPMVVGSLMLWSEARADVMRGRPWDRFRPSALLWLQLIIVALLALALAQPAFVSQSTDLQRLVLVIDASASMAATDHSPTRFDAAIEKARATALAAPPGSEIAVLVSGRMTRVVQTFTRQQEEVDARLTELAKAGPDATASRIDEALVLAMQLGGEGQRETILFSDGAFDQGRLPTLIGSRVRYVGVGQASSNLAIIAFEVRHRAQQRFGSAVMCTVKNTGETRLEGHLQIRAAGALVEAQKVALGPGQSHTLTAPIDIDSGLVEARLEDVRGEGGALDLLALDDVAFSVVQPEKKLSVLLVNGSPLVKRALRANGRFDVDAVTPSEYSGVSKHDLAIFEAFFPPEPPKGHFMVLGMPTDNPLVEFGEALESPSIATWDRGHPALTHLDLGEVSFGTVRAVSSTKGLIPLAEFEGKGGPVLMAGQTPLWRGLVWTAPLLESDLPLRVAFPVLLYNGIGWLNPGQGRGRATATGQAIAVPTPEGGSVEVSGPRGGKWTVQSAGATATFSATSHPGVYETTHLGPEGRRVDRSHGVSMTDATESSIAPRPQLSPKGGPALESIGAVENVRQGQTHVLWLVLVVLTLEWWVYLWRARTVRRRRLG